MSNVLDLLDQTIFDIGQATGSANLLQGIWVYNRPIDLDGVRRFHNHLERGRLSRCVAPSPMPFGRSRWVAPDISAHLEIIESPRPRAAFDDWLDEQTTSPLDCEHGPGWHLAVFPFTDGGAGVSLVVSHCLIDGVGLGDAVADAALGRDDAISWPTIASRSRWQALYEDARQTVRDVPAMGGGIIAAIRLARRGRNGARPATPFTTKSSGPLIEADGLEIIPAATIFVDADEWEARAGSLGGTSNTLLVGFAARLAQRAGRVAADGSVVAALPVNERVAGDTRANAISGVHATVDPAPATTDLREIRSAVKQALIHHREVPDSTQLLNALVPLLSPRLLKAARFVTTGSPCNVVGASNIGMIDTAARRADGTNADSFAMRIHPRGMAIATMPRYGGVQSLLSGTVDGQVFVSLVSYIPGRENSKDTLRQELSTVLNEYSLAGTHL